MDSNLSEFLIFKSDKLWMYFRNKNNIDISALLTMNIV